MVLDDIGRTCARLGVDTSGAALSALVAKVRRLVDSFGDDGVTDHDCNAMLDDLARVVER